MPIEPIVVDAIDILLVEDTAGGGGPVVPEPTSAILLGSVLSLVFAATRKKKIVLS